MKICAKQTAHTLTVRNNTNNMTLIYNLIIVVLSWIIIYLIEKRNIFKTWIEPIEIRIKEFLKGFSLMAFLCVITQLFLSEISNTTWILSNELSLDKLFSSFYYDINSVLFEELLFRGVLLYLLIKTFNMQTGIILSSIAFGIYHWFTGGVFGNPSAMIVVFIVTGFMGYVFAFAYAKTKSLILPFGLHLGWNLINHNVFSNGPNGVMLLRVNEQPDMSDTYQLISFGFYLLVAVTAFIFVNSKYIIKQRSSTANNLS